MKYTLIKIKDEYYLVTDEEPTDRYPCVGFHKTTKEPSIDHYYQDDAAFYVFKPKKIIASTIKLQLAVESKLLNKHQIEVLLGAPIHLTLKEISQPPGLVAPFIQGYKKHAADTAAIKWTDKDMIDFVGFSANQSFAKWQEMVQLYGNPPKMEDILTEFIKSKNVRIEWEVEVEMIEWDVEELRKSGHPTSNLQVEPKITEGYINILKIS